MDGLFERINAATHVDICRPSQRYTYKNGTIAVAPTYVGRCLLVRYKAEIRRRVLIPEGCNARCEVDHSRNHAPCIVAQSPVFYHPVMPVFHHSHVYMQSGTGLSGSYFRGERNIQSLPLGKIADNPLGYHELIGGICGQYR